MEISSKLLEPIKKMSNVHMNRNIRIKNSLFFQVRDLLSLLVFVLRQKHIKNTLLKSPDNLFYLCDFYRICLFLFLDPDFLNLIPSSFLPKQKHYQTLQSPSLLSQRNIIIDPQKKFIFKTQLEKNIRLLFDGLFIYDPLSSKYIPRNFQEKKRLNTDKDPADSQNYQKQQELNEKSFKSAQANDILEIYDLLNIIYNTQAALLRVEIPYLKLGFKDLFSEVSKAYAKELKGQLQSLEDLEKRSEEQSTRWLYEWFKTEKNVPIYIFFDDFVLQRQKFFDEPYNCTLNARDLFHNFLLHIPSVYFSNKRLQAVQGTLFRGSKKKRNSILSLKSNPRENPRYYKDASFFARLLMARNECFTRNINYYKHFSSVNLDGFRRFLNYAQTRQYNTCSGDVLDNGVSLVVRSEVPLLVDKNGTILTPVFRGSFLNQENQRPDISDCVNLQIHRFRSSLHQFDHYSGTENRLVGLLKSYFSKLEFPSQTEVLDAPIQDDEFQNAPGLFWTRFYEIPYSQLLQEKNNGTQDVVKYAASLVNSLKLNGEDLSQVEKVIITEFDGFFFLPTSPQYNAFKARLSYLFNIPYQYRVNDLRQEWDDETTTITKTLTEQNVSSYLEVVETRFSRVEHRFRENILKPYLFKILFEPVSSIWCKLENQKTLQDLQHALLCSPPGTKCRFFTILNNTQMKPFAEEHDLLTALSIYSFGRRNKLFSDESLRTFVTRKIQPFFSRGVSFRKNDPTIDYFLKEYGEK
jgi:hypothetical protein